MNWSECFFKNTQILWKMQIINSLSRCLAFQNIVIKLFSVEWLTPPDPEREWIKQKIPLIVFFSLFKSILMFELPPPAAAPCSSVVLNLEHRILPRYHIFFLFSYCFICLLQVFNPSHNMDLPVRIWPGCSGRLEYICVFLKVYNSRFKAIEK